MTTHIGKHPLPEMYGDGLEIDCQCARCGSSCDWQECIECYDGQYEEADCNGVVWMTHCNACEGRGGTQRCLSSPDWCDANPLPGRESVKRGAIEWFTTPERKVGP